MKDALLAVLVAIVALQALYIWRLTKRRDEQDDCMEEVERDLRAMMQKDSEIKRMKHDERKEPL